MHKKLYWILVCLQTLVVGEERMLWRTTADDALQKKRLAVAAWERVGAVPLWPSSSCNVDNVVCSESL